MATISKTKSGSFKAIIRKNGRVIKTKTFRLKKDARTWSKRIEGDRDAMAAFGSPGAVIAFNTLADEYLDQWAGKDNISRKVTFWKNQFSDTTLINIEVHIIRDILNRYAEGDALRGNGTDSRGKPKVAKTGRKRAPATVNRMRAMLSSIFKYAVKECGYLTTNPVTMVPSRTEDNKRTRFLSDDERAQLLSACRHSQWDKLYLLVLMALTTGARMGELLGLHWDEIDFKERTTLLIDTKNGESRILTIPESTMVELQQFREVGSGLVFPSPTKFRKPFEFRKHWYKAMVDAGIEGFRFHDLRHSCASMLVMNGATLYETAQVLGHKSTQTTARYAHLSVDHKQALTDRILGNVK